jgi:protein O-GlcNAc transferase
MIEIVSATRLSESEFWSKAPLGISLQRLAKDTRLIARIAYENIRGLPEVFNASIDAPEDVKILVFIHDDVWIDDAAFADRVAEGLKLFDVIGVAGNRRRVKNQPAWPFIDENLTWDNKDNLSGSVAHGKFPFGKASVYGAAPAECELLDGVLIAARKTQLKTKGIRFDPCFDFHFYDLDFCRSARVRGLHLGVCPISLTHQSGGAFGSPRWQDSYRLYLDKWETDGECPPMTQAPVRKTDAAAPSTFLAQPFQRIKQIFSGSQSPGHPDATAIPSQLRLQQVDLQSDCSIYHKLGNEYLAKGDLDNAAECYGHMVAVDPNSAAGFLNLGFVLKEQGSYQDAERYLRHAVQIDPAMVDAHYLLGAIEQARGNPAEAIEQYQKTLELKPDFEIVYGDLCQLLFQGGQLENARIVIQQGLSLFPRSAQFHCYLGNLYVTEKKLEQAVTCYRKALDIQPDYAEVHVLLGNVYKDQGALDNALACYRKALVLRPDSFEIYNNLGSSFQAMDNFSEAVACYRKALVLNPDSAEVNCNLGGAFHDQGNLDEAQACYRGALALDPEFADAHNKLGTLFHDRGDLDEAQACYRKALALNPECAEAFNNLGAVFQATGNLDEAAAYYHKALALKPDSVDANRNLGNLFSIRGNLKEAVACLRNALALRPDSPETYNDLGNALRDQGTLDEAAACYSQALMLKPDFHKAHYNLGVVSHEQNKLDKALACYRQAAELDPDFHIAKINLLYMLQVTCEWKDLARLSEEVRRRVREISPATEYQITPFAFLTVSGATPSEQKLCAANWARSRYQSLSSNRKEMEFNFKREPKQKIHIGYLSADFRDHPVAHLMAEVFEIHDRERFRISAYSYGPDDESGAMRKRLERAFDSFVDIRDLTHENAARRIYADHVDILIDLTGYTQYHRSAILALRPAPVQVGYLGYLGTMGADFMDYIIADPFLIPPEHQQFFSEKVAYLSSYQANDRQSAVAETPTRMSCGLPDEGIVFCCFNQTYKILPDVFDVWMRLLKAVPGSVFWIFSPNPFAIANLQREAQARGVAPERLIFAERVPLDRHLARLKCADLFLDTLPYNAGTTASNALWAGLPVITCAGETFSSRMAGSLLTALGVPELITYNLADYYALALDLASDRNKYASIRNKIIANRESAPLFDSTKFTRDLENLYRKMWDEYVISPHAD